MERNLSPILDQISQSGIERKEVGVPYKSFGAIGTRNVSQILEVVSYSGVRRSGRGSTQVSECQKA